MSLTQSDYFTFSNDKNSLFFEPPSIKEIEEKKFQIPSISTKYWNYQVSPDWIYVLRKHEPCTLDQGWKIHITSTPRDAADVLFIVADFLIKRKISFKFVPTVDSLIRKNSKYAARESSGKFITIYPNSNKIFLKLLNELSDLTRNYESGPYILNDGQWKDSNVFFRYGAFTQMRLNINGKIVDAIKTPNGKLVPDKRVPYYYLPDFVTEPQELKTGRRLINPNEFMELKKYNIQEAIHFSNGGGVYKATIQDRTCILKEGRPKAGLDALNKDGFSRVKHEYNVLTRLTSTNGVVKVKRYFKAWKHNYLEEEFIDGVTLDDFIAEHFPFIQSGVKNSTINSYIQDCITIITKLKRIIEKIHKNGIAIGDLQPSNIIFSLTDKTITLIDFESASDPSSKYNPGLMTQGFVSNNAKTYEEADWFALNQIAYYLFVPIDATISTMSPELYMFFDIKITQSFGRKIVDFLHKIRLATARHTLPFSNPLFLSNPLYLPSCEVSIDNRYEVIEGLRNGILNNWDLDSQRLIKGDLQQYSNRVSLYSISNGAFGGIMALMRTGGIPDKYIISLKTWFKNNLPIINSMVRNEFELDNGLFTGMAGISSVLYDLSQDELATEILEKINISKYSYNVSLYSGLAGIGLAELSGYRITSNTKLIKKSEDAANYIIKYFNRRIESPIKQTDVGFLDGLAGEALFLFIIGNEIKNHIYIETSIKIMDYIITNNITYNDDGNLLVSDKSRGFQRFIPYLNNGSAGIAEVMILFSIFMPDYLNKTRKTVLNNLIESNYAYCSVQGSLIDGYAGFLTLSNLVNCIKNNNKLLKYNLKALNLYLVSTKSNEVYVPGRTGLKCSMDIATGASGVLLSLVGSNVSDCLSWMPLPKKSGLFSFQSDIIK